MFNPFDLFRVDPTEFQKENEAMCDQTNDPSMHDHAFVIIHKYPFGNWCIVHDDYCNQPEAQKINRSIHDEEVEVMREKTLSPWVRRALDNDLPTFDAEARAHAYEARQSDANPFDVYPDF